MKLFKFYVEETITREASYTVDAVDMDDARDKVFRREVVGSVVHDPVAIGVRIITGELTPYQTEEKKHA